LPKANGQANQLGGKGGKALGAALSEAVLEMQALVFDVAQSAHPVAQAFERRPWFIGENADATNLRALLSDCIERPSCRAAEKRDERAPPHGLLSSGRSRTLPQGGITPLCNTAKLTL